MKRTFAVPVALSSFAIGVVGCSGNGEVASVAIASDACALLQEEILDRGPEALMAGELTADFEALEARAEEAGLSDPEMEAAMQERCPEIFDELERMFGS